MVEVDGRRENEPRTPVEQREEVIGSNLALNAADPDPAQAPHPLQCCHMVIPAGAGHCCHPRRQREK
jgi:hypothetical protein